MPVQLLRRRFSPVAFQQTRKNATAAGDQKFTRGLSWACARRLRSTIGHDRGRRVRPGPPASFPEFGVVTVPPSPWAGGNRRVLVGGIGPFEKGSTSKSYARC